MRAALLFALIFSIACDASSDTMPPPAPMLSPADAALIDARPFDLRIPANYDKTKPTPLLVLLHGYGAASSLQDALLGIGKIQDDAGFLYALPDGLEDADHKQFWNATDACCNFFKSPVDDVAYLKAVIHSVKVDYNVDPKRVYFVGHSNGGFMSYRMACDASDEVAAIVSLAGATFEDTSRCQPKNPVSVLEVHGDADTQVLYAGAPADPNVGSGAYPGARESVADWAKIDSCPGSLVDTGNRLDLTTDIPGSETTLERYASCAAPGAGVELWTMAGGSHVPVLLPTFATAIYQFLSAHPKP